MFFRFVFTPAFLAFTLLALSSLLAASLQLNAQGTWAFDPERDTFSPDAVLDLSNLNEDQAGQTGWIKANAQGDFVKGDGSAIRFWAVNSSVEREKPYNTTRSDPNYYPEPKVDHLSKWLAKRGANMIRLHAHINPDPETQAITDVNLEDVEWIWRSVGAAKEEGVYTTVSPYWANTMESDDNRWETDWGGSHHGLLFFEETLINAYKEWLRYLFTTPTDLLDGKTLAEEPALAIFQIQNEDSLLFWTVNNLPAGAKTRLGKKFATWAIAKYGSLDQAFIAWNDESVPGDDLAAGTLSFRIIWDLTGAAPASFKDSVRLADQLQFWVETMRTFNAEIERFVHEDLNCPVIVNPGNWKTADVVYLEDAERYSYTSNDVIAVNRYFGGIHQGPTQGWAIQNGDYYTNDSALKNHPRSFPLNLKQVAGKPMMVTESTWVFPNENAFESPMLISAYSSLTGFDAYFWFAVGTDDFVAPRSSNGWFASQEKWLCMTPDMAGQWPAAALAFRRGYIQQGTPAVQEHRSLDSIYQRKSPIIAESASFDPNRDSGDLPPDSSIDTGIDPLAFFTGPVTVTYESSETNSSIDQNLDTLIQTDETGSIIRSNTGELELNTREQTFTINAPKVQALVTYEAATAELDTVTIATTSGLCALTVISLDGQPLSNSTRILAQRGTPARPSGWQAEAAIFEAGGEPVQGKEIVSYGGPPWEVHEARVSIELNNVSINKAIKLNMNGEAIEEIPLSRSGNKVSFDFPEGVMYVALSGGQTYDSWKSRFTWPYPNIDDAKMADPENDGSENLLEYGLDTNPLAPDLSKLPYASFARSDGEKFAIFIYRKNPLSTDIDYVIQSSSDLDEWKTLAIDNATNIEEVLDADPDNDGSAQSIQVKVKWDQGESHKFLRLRIVEKSS